MESDSSRCIHGPLPWTVLSKKNYENLQNFFFSFFILKTLLLRMSQKVYKKYHAQKVLKFALDIELAQLKFTYITVIK